MIFLLLSILFLVTGLALIKNLKDNIPAFYDKFWNSLWIATIILFLSLLVRGILNDIRYFDTDLNMKINQSEMDDTIQAVIYNVFLFLFSDILPLLA